MKILGKSESDLDGKESKLLFALFSFVLWYLTFWPSTHGRDLSELELSSFSTLKGLLLWFLSLAIIHVGANYFTFRRIQPKKP